jgi:hypothetical protein
MELVQRDIAELKDDVCEVQKDVAGIRTTDLRTIMPLLLALLARWRCPHLPSALLHFGDSPLPFRALGVAYRDAVCRHLFSSYFEGARARLCARR